MEKRKRKFKLKNTIIAVIFLVVVLGAIGLTIYKNIQDEKKLNQQEKNNEKLLKEIQANYNEQVITTKKAKLYIKEKNNFKEAGSINKGIEITLTKIKPTIENTHFLIAEFEDEYYIMYDSITPTNSTKQKEFNSDRYIPFNENVETKETTFYNNEGELVYSFKQENSFPILVKEKSRYGVLFNGQLLYIKNDDSSKIVNHNNTDATATNTMSVLAYHFFYEKGDDSCQQVICVSMDNFRQQMQHLIDQNYNFLTTREFEQFIDGEIRFKQNSILITIDDGWHLKEALAYLNEKKINATVAPIASSFTREDFESEYIEVISHSFDMHRNGQCAGMGDQGGGILCLPKDQILNDLKWMRERIGENTVYHVYPFYDYNEYSISVLKEANFRMAFAGYYKKAKVGEDKFKIPRYTVLNNTTFAEFLKII